MLHKGRKWLQKLDDDGVPYRHKERPRDFWRAFRLEIARAFDRICCYTAVYVANGQVDHFIPWARVRGTMQAHQAYQWSNIRYADGSINASKGDAELPDPFVVEDDWFELALPSLVLRATDRVPDAHRQAVANLLQRVGNAANLTDVRRDYLASYIRGAPLTEIDRFAPLVGRALRQNPEFLHAEDRARLEAGEGHPERLSNVSHVEALDLGDVVVSRLDIDGEQYVVEPPARLEPELDDSEQLLFAVDDELGIDIHAETRDELLEVIEGLLIEHWKPNWVWLHLVELRV